MATKETETQEYEVGITIPKEEPKQEQNNYSETKQSTIDKLEEAKDYWNTAHVIGDKILEKSTAGRVYLVIQSTTGSVIVDTASGVPLDEQLVGIAGDIIGGFLFTPAVNAVLILNDISVGDILQGTYKDIKEYIQTDVEGQTWHYEENFNVMVGGQMVHYDYAKVKYGADGNAIFDNATQSPVFEQINKTTYDNYQKSVESLNSLKNINVDNGVKIELDNNQIVSMEKDNIKVIYENGEEKSVVFLDKQENQSQTRKLTEQEIKDEVYKKVREYVHENDITSFQDIGQFMEKVREELKNGTINIENKEQNLKEEIQEEPKEENHSSQVYRR